MNFANPIGLWALLAVPVLVAIYLLRRRPVKVPVAVLFLIERAKTPSRGGRRLERLRTPPQFWLQLLAALLIAALLAGLHFGKSRQVGKIAVVLDSSASVSTFRDPLIQQLDQHLTRLTRPLYASELVVLPSTPNSPRLYRGGDVEELIASLTEWIPQNTAHSPIDALRLARGLAGSDGLVIFATDRPHQSLPEGVVTLSTGEPLGNVGFAGLHASDNQWSAIVKNYTDTSISTQWRAERGETSTSPPRPIQLAAGGMIEINGTFPPDTPPGQGITLHLPEDAFTHDNALPIARPLPKILWLAFGDFVGDSPGAKFAIKLSTSLPHTEFNEQEAVPDIVILPASNTLPQQSNAIAFASSSEEPVLTGSITPAPHPLTEGLPWGSLVPFVGQDIEILPSDTGLLWIGERPVIALRSGENGAEHLLIDLDLDRSNAVRLPAIALLVHRFAERVRDRCDRPSAGNVEIGQRLPEGKAPLSPGFFSLNTPEGTPLFSGAASFADVSEADLREAAPINEIPERLTNYTESRSTNTSLWRVLLILALLCLLASWAVTRSSNPTQEEVPSA